MYITTQSVYSLYIENFISSASKINDGDLCLMTQWREIKRLADYFWKCWIKKYLHCLINHSKWQKDNEYKTLAKVVVIVDSLSGLKESDKIKHTKRDNVSD